MAGGVIESLSLAQTVGGGLLVSQLSTINDLFRVSVLCLAASSSRYRGVRHPPRVAIAGSNRGFSRLTWSAEPTLLSLLWYKRGVRLPLRVANMVQTPGETLAGKPVDVSISMG